MFVDLEGDSIINRLGSRSVGKLEGAMMAEARYGGEFVE